MKTSEIVKRSGKAAEPSSLSVKVFYFARLKEMLGRGHEDVILPASAATVGALRERLRQRGGVWEAELAPHRAVRASVNHDMTGMEARLSDGDEVAFFPPVTGG